MSVTREAIIGALRKLESMDWVYSLYEGGAAAWGRVDEWSDIDLGITIAKGRLEEGFHAVAEALTSLAPIDLVFDVPNPPATAQKLYHVEGASPFLIIDLCFDECDITTPAEGCIETDVHGHFICHFDKSGEPRYGLSDKQALKESLTKRLAALPIQFKLFQTMPLKEINRGNRIEALVFYTNATLKLLVELLGIKHRPARSTFHTRYIYNDFPKEVVARLERLYFIGAPEELAAKREEAETWFFEILDEIDLGRSIGS